MKKGPEVLFLVVFAVCVAFFACTDEKEEPGVDTSSSEGTSHSSSSSTLGTSSNSGVNSSDSQNQESSSSGGVIGESSNSQDQSSADGISSSSPSSSSPSSSSVSSSSHTPEVTDPGANCAYQPTWCGGISFDKVKKTSMDAADVGATDKGQERPNCIYATAITQIGNESAGISINGRQFATGSASRCGGGEWGDATACATKFSSVAKVDGGYYIYIPDWAGQKFQTTGGQPSCPSTPTPGASSSSRASSSSAGSNTGACVEPMNGLPPNGTKSCIKVGSKCYTCNPDRGNECSQGWIWQGGNVSDQYWYKEVSCTENSGVTPTYNLTCTGLAATGIAGTAITQPSVKCNGDNASATFSGAPTNWNSPTTGTYNVSATANCGGNKTVSCGTLTVSAAPSTDQLTCTGLAQTGVAGTAITQPTVKCGTNTVTSGLTWTNAPTWTNPTANNYTVSVAATCGGSSKTASCGTLKVSPKLTCGNPSPANVTAGTNVTPPTVTCGSTNVATANVSWSGNPTYWSSPESGTYNNIKATANTGDCSGQTATCGTLTVGNKLTCGNIAQTITVGQTPTKASNLVTCGSTNVTSGITWNPTSVGGAINTAQTINNITATASCGGSNQTATCTGSIVVNAQSTTPSSSSTGGGGGSYTPKSPGSSTAKTTQYWDACKPSCGWSGKGGLRASSCNITGGGKAKNDEASACSNGNSYTCMDQAPWKVGNVSFGYAAINMGDCGDCYQLDFPNGHVMVVMKSNIGNLNEGAAFDIMIPGGGAGDFDALTKQVQNSGISNPDMGNRYGGFRLACNNSVSCVKQKCDATFKNLPDLRAGCNWYADNLGTNNASFDNPTVKYQKVTCPSELTGKY
ncbi:MAG: hypothetical protein LBC87_07470 [Fibromonadaceae bacterium]|nr:hypothetical protein [Fibromonadaceae bacterium]